MQPLQDRPLTHFEGPCCQSEPKQPVYLFSHETYFDRSVTEHQARIEAVKKRILQKNIEKDIYFETGAGRTLDLSDKSLSVLTLPSPSAGLNVLIFCDNVLCTLPQEIGQQQYLTTLRGRGNYLTTLPETFSLLENLTHVSLVDNAFSKVPPQLLRLPQLTFLDLSENCLRELPQELALMPQLTKFVANRNPLPKIPDEVFLSTSLKELFLNSNNINALPKTVGSTARLEILSLNENGLKELPEALNKCSSLRTLSVEYNSIQDFPSDITPPNLAALCLTGNQFSTVSFPSNTFGNLMTLRLSRNKISHMQKISVATLQQLQELELSGNDLRVLPDMIFSLSALKTLDLSDNRIATLPPAIAKLKELKTLSLTNNQLTALPEEVEELEQLSTLELSSNLLQTLPFGTKPSVIHKLFLERNAFQQIPSFPKTQEKLKVYFDVDKKKLFGKKHIKEAVSQGMVRIIWI
jgi:leucine-rich repeat protein SHOC2